MLLAAALQEGETFYIYCAGRTTGMQYSLVCFVFIDTYFFIQHRTKGKKKKIKMGFIRFFLH